MCERGVIAHLYSGGGHNSQALSQSFASMEAAPLWLASSSQPILFSSNQKSK